MEVQKISENESLFHYSEVEAQNLKVGDRIDFHAYGVENADWYDNSIVLSIKKPLVDGRRVVHLTLFDLNDRIEYEAGVLGYGNLVVRITK